MPATATNQVVPVNIDPSHPSKLQNCRRNAMYQQPAPTTSRRILIPENVGLLQITAMRARCPRPDNISQTVSTVLASKRFSLFQERQHPCDKAFDERPVGVTLPVLHVVVVEIPVELFGHGEIGFNCRIILLAR